MIKLAVIVALATAGVPAQEADAFFLLHAGPSGRKVRRGRQLFQSELGKAAAESVARSVPKMRPSALAAPHHVAIRTRDIENAIKFYSLLGFRVETKFRAGPARAAWLTTAAEWSQAENESVDVSPLASGGMRIELIEVPPHVLNEQDGTRKRALDLFQNEALLGLNHFALDVTDSVQQLREDNSSELTEQTRSETDDATTHLNLQDWIDALNYKSVETFGKTLRVAMAPQQRMIGKHVFELAFLYDADGAIVELLNYQTTLSQEVEAGWEPWAKQEFPGLGEGGLG